MYLAMPWRDDKGQLKLMNYSWLIPGLGDVSDLISRGATNPVSSIIQSPVVNMLGTLATKTKPSGVPLYYDWEDPSTKASKTLKYMWEVWSPAVAPGNVDWTALQEAIEDRPESLTATEAIAAQFGMRLTSVDPAILAKRAKSLERLHQAEASMQMKRQLRRSISDEETQNIIDSWSKSIQSIRER